MGPAPATAFALLEQIFWVGFDRLAGPVQSRLDGVPLSVAQVDVDWVGEALQGAFSGAVVEQVERLGGHSGTTTRETLKVLVSGNRSLAVPSTFFLKITPEKFSTRLFTTLLGLGSSEVAFYRSLGDRLPIRVPRVYCARHARRGGRFVLLMEDLASAGARFTTSAKPVSLDEARAVMTTLGRLHAAYWESPELDDDLAWLRSPENNPTRGFEWWLSARSNQPALARFRDVVPDRVRENAHRIHAARPLLEAHWAALPRTLIHGDPHSGNLYFQDGEVGFFDWQVVQAGHGLRDVSYFLLNSMDTPLRRSQERTLIEHYLAVLTENGVAAPSAAAAWEEHRLFALYAWIAISVTAATAGLQDQEIVARAIESVGQGVEDLDSFAALDDLVSRAPERERTHGG
ncbi:MAG: phosphotransferase [Deltaproteobacteria bacterium]|nr:phosphotransferase [Deltaproteobacteria bacterium]